MEKNKQCEDCKERESRVEYSDNPYMSLTHGWGTKNICRQCFIKRIEEHIGKCHIQLKEERELLLKEKKE